MDAKDTDIKFMRLAMAEARKGLGKTSPNPAVGAVIVRGGKVLARGYHKKAGTPHAEVVALKKLGNRAKDATLYVTLEPCNHHGRTPPCTEAILNSGIRRVVVGMRDPNPGVKGGGCEYLAQQGVEVHVGVLQQECKRLIEAYVKFVTTGRPFLTLKSAVTLDGWIATTSGHSKWITGEKARRYVHRLRRVSDAVMVGAGTVMKDDPLLTARVGLGRGRQPHRIVVDSYLRSPASAKIFSTARDVPTIAVVGLKCGASAKIKELENMGVQIVKCPVKRGMIDLDTLMDILGSKNIQSLLVEGGAKLNYSLLRARLVDKLKVFLAPKLLGGGDGVPMFFGKGPSKIDGCVKMEISRVRKFDRDIMISGYPRYE